MPCRSLNESVVPKMSFLNSGSYVHLLQPQDRVVADGVALDVLSVRQHQTPREGGEVLATFKDGSAAIVRMNVGSGMNDWPHEDQGRQLHLIDIGGLI